jgi:hypothetical protein
MQFLKKHYEKILLGLVLLGLAVMSIALVFLVSNEKDQQEARRNAVTIYTPKPLDPPKLEDAEAALRKAETPLAIEFADDTNKLFNPLRWQMKPDHTIFPNPPAAELNQLEILNIRPLYFTVSLEHSNVTDSGVSYGIRVSDAAAHNPKAANRLIYLKKGDLIDPLKLEDVKGPPNDPAELDLQLTDTGEKISVSKTKSYQRISDFVADLKYPPENNRLFRDVRANDPMHDRIVVNGTPYNVLYITNGYILFSAPSHKKTIKSFTPTPH